MQIIHESSVGYVAKCQNCDSIQISIGNMVISGDYIDFLELSGMILSVKKFPQELSEMIFPILSSSVHLVLKRHQFEKAKDLINYSKIYFQTQQILDNGK